MWGDEAHLPAWPTGPATGIAARAWRAARRGVRRYAVSEPRPGTLVLNAWVGLPDPERSGSGGR
jgi:hypothetical protein